FCFRPEATDVTHVMLSARIRTTGEVDVHGLIQINSFRQPFSEFERMALGVRLGEFAITIAGTGNYAAGNVRLFYLKTGFLQRPFERGHKSIRHIWNDEILPYRQPDF